VLAAVLGPSLLDSAGAPRGGRTGPAISSNLVINELDYVQPGREDMAEFLELKNVSGNALQLAEFVLVWLDADGKEYRARLRLPAATLLADEYFVACASPVAVPNCDFPFEEAANIWRDQFSSQFNAFGVALVKNAGTRTADDVLVDAVAYDGFVSGQAADGQPWTESASVQPGDNDRQAELGISRLPDGEDHDNNRQDFSPRCITPGSRNTSANGALAPCSPPSQLPTVMINELDTVQSQDVDDAEFIELKNATSNRSIYLGDYAVLGIDHQSAERRTFPLAQVTLPPGRHFVLCGNLGTVDNCDQVLDAGGDILPDGEHDGAAFAVALVRRFAGQDSARDVRIDSVSYDGSVPGGPASGGTWTEARGIAPGDSSSWLLNGLSRLPDGTDTEKNYADFSVRCITPGYTNTGATGPTSCQPPDTRTPTATATDTATATRTPLRATATDTASATPTRTASPTASPRSTSTATVGPVHTATPSATPTATPSASLTPVVALPPLRVSSESNGADQQPGDGQCADALRRCTLRAAIMEANSYPAAGPLRILFTRAMRITVPEGNALPAITRGDLLLDGRDRGTLEVALEMGRWLSRRADQPPDAQEPDVVLAGPGGLTETIGLEISGANNVVVQGLRVEGFRIGILLHQGAAQCRIGTDGDGRGDDGEGNVILGNRQAEVAITDVGTAANWVSGNLLGVDAGGNVGPGPAAQSAGVHLLGMTTDNVIGRRGTIGGPRGAANRIQGGHTWGVRIAGVGTQGNHVAGNWIGAEAAPDWETRANEVGVGVVDGARDNVIGVDADGMGDAVEGNRIAFNLRDGVQIELTATGIQVRGNELDHNLRHGIRMGQTRVGGSTLSRNRITANGGAGIAVAPLGPELAPPSIDLVEPSRGAVSGQGCRQCTIELFADPVNEARRYLGTTTVDRDGLWSIARLDIPSLAEVVFTATATDASGNTSRLSWPFPVGGPGSLWRLVSIPPHLPRAMGSGQVLQRTYRLLNEQDTPVPDADVRWTPLDQLIPTNAQGLIHVAVPFGDLLRFGNWRSAMSVEAVARHDGTVHPVWWDPHMAASWVRPAPAGETILDLSGLGPNGIGGQLRAAGPAVAGRVAQAEPDSQGADGFGAAFAAAPVASLKEGQYAWQENLARGGGIYELHAGDQALSGELEIVAPIEAYNDGGASSACTGTPTGATIAGWNHGSKCWVPLPGTEINALPGASTFLAKGSISIPAGSWSASLLQATTVYTLYTVGYDTAPSTITLKIANGSVLTEWPDVIAEAPDDHAGVNTTSGITVTLGGTPAPVSYDPVTRQVRMPEGSRTLPPSAAGLRQLHVEIRDGFCNRATAVASVLVDPKSAATATPTAGPRGPNRIYAPFARQTRPR
jgi:hypothetical protein